MLKFRSKFEKHVYESAVNEGLSLEFEPFKMEYSIRGRYIPDWLLPNGIIVETKGYLDARSRVKMVAVKQSHPDADIRFVFMDANKKLSKNSKMTYAMWAKKYDFLYAEGTIPLKWFNEKRKDFA